MNKFKYRVSFLIIIFLSVGSYAAISTQQTEAQAQQIQQTQQINSQTLKADSKYKTWRNFYETNQNSTLIKRLMSPSMADIISYDPAAAHTTVHFLKHYGVETKSTLIPGRHYEEIKWNFTCDSKLGRWLANKRQNKWDHYNSNIDNWRGEYNTLKEKERLTYKEKKRKRVLKAKISWYECNTSEKKEIDIVKKEKRTGLKWRLSPIVFVDFDFGRKIVNLTPDKINIQNNQTASQTITQTTTQAQTQTASQTQTTATQSQDQSVIKAVHSSEDKFDNGYRVSNYWRWGLGLGIAETVKFTNANTFLSLFNGFVGLLPIRGSSFIAHRFATDYRAIGQLPRLKIPYTAEEVKNKWTPGDSLTFENTGGVLFMAGISWAGVGVGPSYSRAGTWEIKINILEDSNVFVNMTNRSTTAINKSLGAVVFALTDSEFGRVSKSLSFILDLKDKDAGEAYEDLLRGNAIAAQKLSADETNLAAIAVEDVDSKTIGRIFSKSIILPIPYVFNRVSSRGRISTDSKTVLHPEKSESEISYSVFLQNRSGQFFNLHDSLKSMFTGVAYTTTSKDGSETDGYFGRYIWKWEDDHTSTSELSKGLSELRYKTGLKNETAVKFNRNNHLRYVNIELQMDIPKESTDFLMEMASNPVKSIIFRTMADKVIDDYYKSYDAKKTKFYTKKIVDRMIKALQTMNDVGTKDKKVFSKAYVRFGELMLYSKFTFQTVFNLLKGRGMDLTFQIVGERIPFLKKRFDYIPVIQ